MTLMTLHRCLSTISKNIIASTEKLVYPSMSAHQYILEGVEKKLNTVIGVDAMTKAEMTGEELVRCVGKMANKLKSIGIGSGDHVAIVALNNLNYLPAKLGVMAAGGVPVLFNPLHNAHEFEQLMKISKCNYAIGHICSSAQLSKVAERHKLTILPNLELMQDWSKDESSICPEFNGSTSDTSMMMFSSGTTGLPKAVELSHDNLNSQLASLNVSSNIQEVVPDDINPIFVDFLPEFHTYGSILTHYVSYHGYQRIMLPMFSPDLFLQSIQDYKAHATTMVPPIMLMMSKLDIVPNYDLSSLRLVVVGAAPLAPEVEQAAVERLVECNPGMDLRVCQGYGTTETSGVTLFARIDAPYKAGTVGSVVAGQEVKLVNTETGELCGPHERGEIYIRGPQIMKGYFNNPEANKSAFDKDGWLISGDIAYYDDDKQFFIVDRLKEFIKVNAHQVAPAELEAVLITHKNIADAAVIGVPHERTGEAPMAYVVLPYGVKMTERDIKKFVASKVSDYKQLYKVEFVRTIPKLPSGKIQRRLLREKYTESQSK